MASCAGTTKKDRSCTMPAAEGSDYCYLHDPDPAVAARRRRNASRVASIGNSKIDGEIRDVRLMTKELVEQTVSGELDLRVKRRLTEITQLIQSYCRLAELDLAAGGRPRFSEPGEYGLPEDTADKAKEWAGREGEKARIMEDLAAFNKDPMGTLKAMKWRVGGSLAFSRTSTPRPRPSAPPIRQGGRTQPWPGSSVSGRWSDLPCAWHPCTR